MQVAHSSQWIVFVVTLACGTFDWANGAIRDYLFEVSYFKANPDNTKLAWIQGINGSIPGPTIYLKRGDRLRLTLVNKCQTEKLSLHFHGFEMRHSQEYDGAMPITQCGLQPSHTMVYEFDIDEHPGTYIYHEHAHITHVAGIGFFGAMIVEEADNDHRLWATDYCSHCDEIIAIFDYWTYSPHGMERIKIGRRARPPMVSDLSNGVGLLPFNNLLINGKGAFNVFGNHELPNSSYVTPKTKVSDLFEITPSQGETWRLRIINAGSLFAYRFRIDGHRLKVIQTDAADVLPFECDAVTLSSGERFDVLVEFNKEPGSYWMRAETLEKGSGIHHGQLGVVRYSSTPKGVLPDKGFGIKHFIEDDTSLVTLNCVDQAPLSHTCLPITALRRHTSKHSTHVAVGHIDDERHDFEVSLRAWYGLINAHMTRVLDLRHGGNPYGENQFDGVYTEFAFPAVPYSYVNGTSAAEHENTVKMEVDFNETVRVVIQAQDRAAHPWHLHGHKFAVLAQGFPDYTKDCDIIYCRSEHNHWISRDGAIEANGKFTSFGNHHIDEDARSRSPTLLDPQEAPLKDTVHLPAGGWAVIQFKADNPGWWFFHCHMAIHAHGGMALVLVEGVDRIPARLYNTTYFEERGFPSCKKELDALQAKGPGKSCSCYQNPEMKLDNFPRDTYNCTNTYLCGQLLLNPLDPAVPAHPEGAERNWADGTPWRVAMFFGWCLIVTCFFALKHYFQRRFKKKHNAAMESTSHAALAASGAIVAQVAEELGQMEHFMGTSVNNLSHSIVPLKVLFGKPEVEQVQVQYSMPLEFVACEGASPEAPAVAGVLEPGSVLLMVGPASHTSAWTDFFGARVASSSGVTVRGNIRLGGLHLADWERAEIRQGVGFIGQPIEALRPSIAVLEALDFYMYLGCSDAVHRTFEDRLEYRHSLIAMLKLRDYLSTPMGDLRPHILLRVRIAQELLLPRSVLVMHEPLSRLDAFHAQRVVKLLSMVAKHLKVTMIFSAEHVIGGVGRYATHGLIVTKHLPIFGSPGDLEGFCSYLSTANKHCPDLPPGTNVFEHCSRLFAKNFFEDLTVSSANPPQKAKSDVDSSPKSCSDVSPLSGVRAISDGSKIPSNMSGRSFSYGNCTFSFKVHDRMLAFGEEAIAETIHINLLRRVLLSLGFVSSTASSARPHRKHKSLFRQIKTLTYFECLKGLKEFVTVYAFAEKLTLGIVAGIVWWRKGHLNTQTSLGEIFGLLFFTTGLHTVPPVFQALHEVPQILRIARQEFLGGLYSLYCLAIAMFFSTFLTMAALWPPFWQILAYTCAEVGPTPEAMIKMHIVLALNVLTMHTMGLVIALIIPPPATNVVVGNLIAQLFMLTNGFYTKLPSAFMWVTVLSIPRYTLKALLKLQFTWDDTFRANPMVGLPAFGFPTVHLPAQLTGLFLTMEEREMDVMKTGEQLGFLPEVVALLLFTLAFHIVFITLLFIKVHASESTRTKYADAGFNVLDTSVWRQSSIKKDGQVAVTIETAEAKDDGIDEDDAEDDDGSKENDRRNPEDGPEELSIEEAMTKAVTLSLHENELPKKKSAWSAQKENQDRPTKLIEIDDYLASVAKGTVNDIDDAFENPAVASPQEFDVMI